MSISMDNGVRMRADSVQSVWTRVLEFFDARERPYALALIRMGVPLVLLIGVVSRWPHAREIYSLDGAPAPMWVSYGTGQFLPLFAPSLAVALLTVLMAALLMVSIGWQTRIALLICLVLYPYFGLIDVVSTLTKYTVVSTHVLLLLALSNCGDVWSVDSWLSRQPQSRQLAPVWPRRLIQILIGATYLGSGITKVQVAGYFTGDHLRTWFQTNLNFPNPAGEVLSAHADLLIVMAYSSFLWEVLFPFLCWKSPSRSIMLAFGVLFHITTIFTLGLIIFPSLFLVLYLSFMNEAQASAIGTWFASHFQPSHHVGAVRGLLQRVSPRWSLTLSGVVLALVSILGARIEAQMDVYGEHRPEGRYELTPLPQERVEELLSNEVRMRTDDLVDRFDVGTTCFHGVLVDHCETVREGKSTIAQCTLVHPHEDLWIEVNLHDDDGRVIERNGQIAARQQLRSNFIYKFDERLPAGRYHLVLRLRGEDVASRTIEYRR